MITNAIRKPTVRGLHQMGIARFSASERLERAQQDITAIRDSLVGPFLFGETPTAADACVAPQLAGIMATPVTTSLRDALRSDVILNDYVQRVNEMLL